MKIEWTDLVKHFIGQVYGVCGTMAKVEVRIKYCCCCGLSCASLLVATYTLILYIVYFALALWGLLDTPEMSRYYDICEREARGNRIEQGTERQVGDTRVIIYDVSDTPYFCSLGLFTKELKYSDGVRFPVLILNLIIFMLVILSAILIFAAYIMKMQWLILPWIGMMSLDVLRGIISCILIFVFSFGSLTRIAVGIFFLGVQLFHISLILIMVAKFQRMHDKRTGVDYKTEKIDKGQVFSEGPNYYPTLPSQYGYGTGTRRDGYYQPQYSYNTYAGPEGRHPQYN